MIDEEVGRILLEADQKAEQLLREHRNELESITRALLEHEELGEAELTELIGPSIQARAQSEKEDAEENKTVAPDNMDAPSPDVVTKQDQRQ